MSEKWTEQQRAEYAEILKGFRRSGVISEEAHESAGEYKVPDGWSFLSDNIRWGENGMRRQGVCYAFPPGTKFRIGRP